MRQIIGAAAAAVVLLGAGCTSDTTDGAQPASAPAGTATHHHGANYSPPPAPPLRSGERHVTLKMPKPYTPNPPEGGTDEYRCFLVDPKFTKRTYLTGSQFLPQNAAIVHHAIFFRVEPADIAEARQLDAKEAGEGWQCFGGTGIGGAGPRAQLRGGSTWVASWAPGGRERLLDPGLGYVMEPGSQMVMQVHYSLLATDGKAAGTDQSSIRLRLRDDASTMTPLQTRLLTGPVELPCAPNESGGLCQREYAVLDVIKRFGSEAGATVAGLNVLCNKGKPPVPGNTQRCDRTIRESGTVYAVAGHMHLLGRQIKVELNPGTPKAQTLLNVTNYNFDDQGARKLPKPVKIKPGDVYRVTCTHDVTLRQKLPELQKLKPRYVVWGDGTADEMCLGVVIWTRG